MNLRSKIILFLAVLFCAAVVLLVSTGFALDQNTQEVSFYPTPARCVLGVNCFCCGAPKPGILTPQPTLNFSE